MTLPGGAEIPKGSGNAKIRQQLCDPFFGAGADQNSGLFVLFASSADDMVPAGSPKPGIGNRFTALRLELTLTGFAFGPLGVSYDDPASFIKIPILR